MTRWDVNADRPGRYMTDGTHLLRIVTPVGWTRDGGLVEVEDCATLGVILMPADDLQTLRDVRVAGREPARDAVPCAA